MGARELPPKRHPLQVSFGGKKHHVAKSTTCTIPAARPRVSPGRQVSSQVVALQSSIHPNTHSPSQTRCLYITLPTPVSHTRTAQPSSKGSLHRELGRLNQASVGLTSAHTHQVEAKKPSNAGPSNPATAQVMSASNGQRHERVRFITDRSRRPPPPHLRRVYSTIHVAMALKTLGCLPPHHG